MFSHIKLGANDSITGKYVPTYLASKTKKYKCPVCKKEVEIK